MASKTTQEIGTMIGMVLGAFGGGMVGKAFGGNTGAALGALVGGGVGFAVAKPPVQAKVEDDDFGDWDAEPAAANPHDMV